MIKYIKNHLDKIIGAAIVLAIFGWLLSFNPWGIFEGLKMICNFNEMILVSIWQNKVFNIFFIDHYGKFNWIGITSILAIATLTLNAWDRRRQFKADLVSQSRIKWMAEVRPIVARFIEEISNYMYLYNRFAVDNKPSLNSQLTEIMSNIKKDYYLIKLYVPTKSNEKLLNKIELLFGELHYISEYYDYGLRTGKIDPRVSSTPYLTVVDKYISQMMNQAVEDGQAYFKDEWKRAKSGD
ncbi:hypothetical protein [Lactiplantibacillus plantarum]|uniref:hypothetical protein n=1 Tax=Lactiplantibacillus plantarum TaxID=1590 RepID=UPI000717A0DF|nr:hypothetical protein [Lactiplantibacillus plantarum]KRU19080.1 hypothetical protein ASU25_13290 [Lactiplantibacillus plantarum]CAB1721839.1 hypothetical protein LAP9491_02778 [Lactiplantibacillus plantarum]